MKNMKLEIINIIYKYFPQNVVWGCNEYFNSQEFINYLNTVKLKKDSGFNNILFNELKIRLKHNSIKDWSNFELYNDIELKILLNQDIEYMDDDIELLKAVHNNKNEIIIYVSLISNFYYILYLNTTIKNGDYYFNTKEQNSFIENIIEKLFIKYNYKKLDKHIAQIIVPNIETELKQVGEVTVFDCLFNDVTTL